METGKTVRKPVVAGMFYPARASDLKKLIEECFLSPLGPGSLPGKAPPERRRTVGVVSPHAGFIYSGPVAARGFLKLAGQERPRRVIILGPNHQGMGAPLAVSGARVWETPLGRVMVDGEGVSRLQAKYPAVETDESAHLAEHSLEVQVPFLQYIYGEDFAVIPLAMEWQGPEDCEALGRGIAAAFSPDNTLVVASSDFTHYESQQSVNRKDGIALEAIRTLDAAALAAAATRYSISACGIGPIIAMMTACLQWGPVNAELLGHATSGDTGGDYSRVVGYASVAVNLK